VAIAKLLEGNKIAEKIESEAAEDIRQVKSSSGRGLKLCALQIGQDHESELYLEFQKKTAAKLGIDFELKNLSKNVQKREVIKVISVLNNNPNIQGIILQLPLPGHLDINELRCFLNPHKDIEGIHPENLGRLVLGIEEFAPCTPSAVMELLRQADIDCYGKEAVIVGHSAIVGKPLSLMMMKELATTTVCHIATSERKMLQDHVSRAEILVVAVGKPHIIKGDWIKQGAVVIDVGINCLGNKIVGDVDFEEAQKKASFITPVPGGVGPVTVALLMRNLVKAAIMQLGGEG